MVFFISDINADVRAQTLLGKPFFLVDECVRYRTTVPQWRVSGSWASGADITDATRPVRRVYDGQLGAPSSPDSSIVGGSSDVSLLLDLVASVDRGFDTAMIGVDLAGCGTGITVSLEIADTNDFTGASFLLLGSAPNWEAVGNGNRKIILWDINNNGNEAGQDIREARYLRVRFSLAGNWAAPPKVYEVALGRRAQFSHFPRYPHATDQRASIFSDYRADSGWVQRVIRSAGMQPIEMTLKPQAGGIHNIDDVAQINAWFQKTGYGARNFLYCDHPGLISDLTGAINVADPPVGLWCLPPTSIAIPATGPNTYEFATAFPELPPYRINEVDA